MLQGSLTTGPAEAVLRSDLLLLMLLALLAATACVALVRLGRGATGAPPPQRSGLADPQRQLEAVRALRFEVMPILSPEERSMFRQIEAALQVLQPGARLLARVSLDEVVRPRVTDGRDWDRAATCIRSKRLDFAIFDAEGRIVAAIGCSARARQMGEGRDRVRRMALERAGVPYLSLDPGLRVEEICQALHTVISPPNPPGLTNVAA